MKKILISGLVAISLFGFNGNSSNQNQQLSDTTVVAVVDGKKIRIKDINDYLQGISGDYNLKVQNLPKQHLQQFINQYIDTLIYYKKAKAITHTPEFKAAMMKLAVDMWLKYKLDNIKVSEKEAKEFYEKYKDIYFKAPPQIKARHIVVKDETLAKKIIDELKGLKGKALEEKFAELAKKYSTGPTKVNGGELGWFDPKQMVPSFAEAVKNMKVGELTLKPVKTKFGYHVILVEDKKKAGYIPFEEAKPQIIEYLKRVKLQEELQKLKNSVKVEYKKF